MNVTVLVDDSDLASMRTRLAELWVSIQRSDTRPKPTAEIRKVAAEPATVGLTRRVLEQKPSCAASLVRVSARSSLCAVL